jgi:hypothetical protein
MKIRLFLVIGLLCSFSAQTYALSFMGPPTAERNQGQWSVGYNYSYSVQDLDKVRQNWIMISDGATTSTGEGRLRFEDLTVQRHYIGINCGFTDWWELYARIGLSDVKGDIHWFDDERKIGYDFDDDYAWGWGTKVTFKKSDTVAWGAALHLNWLDTSTAETVNIPGSGPRRDTVTIDTYEVIFAVGPTIDMGGWKLYGGPFYYDMDGDYERHVNFFELDSIEREDAKIKEDGSFGAFAGAVMDLADNSDLTAEIFFTSDGWGFGAGIAHKF